MLRFLIVLFVLFNFCSCNQVFFKQKPLFQSIDSTLTSGYVKFNQPYYKKKPTAFGVSFKILLAGGASYFILANKETLPLANGLLSNDLILGSGAALGMFSLHSIVNKLAGSGKINKLSLAKESKEWMDLYNKRHKSSYVLVTDSSYSNKDVIFTIPEIYQNSFVPKNYNDLINYKQCFPFSIYYKELIEKSAGFLTRHEAEDICRIFGPSLSVIAPAKLRYIILSKDEEQFKNSLDDNLEMLAQVEGDYFKIIKSVPYVIDFFKKYPNSKYADALFKNHYKRANRNEIIEFLQYSKSSVNTETKEEGERYLIFLSRNFNEFVKTSDSLENAFFSPLINEIRENPSNLRELFNSVTKFKVNNPHNLDIDNLLTDIYNKYLTTKYSVSKINEDSIISFIKENSFNEWIENDKSNQIFDSLVFDFLDEYNLKEYFIFKDNEAELNGKGRRYTSNGNYYEGVFEEGILNGEGIYRNKDKELFNGNFKNELFNGNGKYYKKDNQIFIGEFVSGKFTGKGTKITSKGDSLVGEFFEFKLNGEGKRINADGSKYFGFFNRNEFHGKGIYFWSDGVYFEGNFNNGNREGVGIIAKEGNFGIKGEWKNDCPSGLFSISTFSKNVSGFKEKSEIKLEINDCEVNHLKDFNMDPLILNSLSRIVSKWK